MSPIEWLDPDSSFKHWIGSDLRFYREGLQFSLAQMGRAMGCSRHTVSNIEHARDGWNMNEDQAAKLDVHLKLNGHFGRLVRYARTAHDPDWFAEYANYETKAIIVRLYRLSLVPGLFQTPEYARAAIVASRMVDDIELAVENRMKRAEVLEQVKGPDIWVILDESVLYRPVGGEVVMRGQLMRLCEVARLSRVTMRVVPMSKGFHLGLDGSFNSLTMENEDLAFVEAPGGGRLIRGSLEVREFGIRWDHIGANALPWDSSLDLLEQATERFS